MQKNYIVSKSRERGVQMKEPTLGNPQNTIAVLQKYNFVFQKKFGLKPQEIAVVGDTYNDIRFARENGGVAIGVLSGVSQEADFCGEADYILNSVGELPQLLEQI